MSTTRLSFLPLHQSHLSKHDAFISARRRKIQKRTIHHSFTSTSLSTLEQIANKTSEGSISNDQSSPSSLKLFESQQKISSTSAVTQSVVVPIQQLSSVNRSQLMPDFIINDKQITNRIFNENRIPSTAEFILDQIISDHINQSKTATELRSNDRNSSSSVSMNSFNLSRPFHLDQIVTSTSHLLIDTHRLQAHAVSTSESIFSETSFIILICTLTILILLCCFALVCLCRRKTRRTISPSFDGGNPTFIVNDQQQMPLDKSNFRPEQFDFDPFTASTQTSIPTQHGIKQNKFPTMKIKKKNIKKKRLSRFCCCSNSKRPVNKSIPINARVRTNRNEF